MRGGRFKAVNCRFFNNVCARTGPDVGGAAIRVFDQYNDLPVFITNCTFGGAEGYGNYGSNGSGDSGGAIYNDGNTMTLTILGTLIEENRVNAHGSAVFFVSNDHSGNIIIEDSVIRNNHGGTWYPVYPGISMHGDTDIQVTNSTITD